MSIYRDEFESEAKKELIELEEKKATSGWTQKDADRYNQLLKELSR